MYRDQLSCPLRLVWPVCNLLRTPFCSIIFPLTFKHLWDQTNGSTEWKDTKGLHKNAALHYILKIFAVKISMNGSLRLTFRITFTVYPAFLPIVVAAIFVSLSVFFIVIILCNHSPFLALLWSFANCLSQTLCRCYLHAILHSEIPVRLYNWKEILWFHATVFRIQFYSVFCIKVDRKGGKPNT